MKIKIAKKTKAAIPLFLEFVILGFIFPLNFSHHPF